MHLKVCQPVTLNISGPPLSIVLIGVLGLKERS
jgi:hypothetical protein